MNDQWVSVPNQTYLTLPKGKGDGTFAVETTSLMRMEAKIPDIRQANPLTLPDLIVDFTLAISMAGKTIAQVEQELKEGERELEMCEAIALLERVEPLLKAKGIKSSTDTRQAQISLDKDVIAARERVDILTTTVKYLENMHKAFEMAYYSAKKICEYQSLPGGSRNLAGGR